MKKTIKSILCITLLFILSVSAFAYERAYVSCDVLNVRVSPNTECSIIKQITTNTPVDIIYTTDTGWCSVLFEDNSTGFVCARYLKMEKEINSSLHGNAIANDAHNYLGYRYVYGTAFRQTASGTARRTAKYRRCEYIRNG